MSGQKVKLLHFKCCYRHRRYASSSSSVYFHHPAVRIPFLRRHRHGHLAPTSCHGLPSHHGAQTCSDMWHCIEVLPRLTVLLGGR